MAGTEYKVTLGTTRMEKNIIKQINYVKPLTGGQRQIKDPNDPNFGPKPVFSIDLLRMDIRYTIEGWIVEGGYTGDTSTDMTTRKNHLQNMVLSGGVIKFNYDDETNVEGSIDQIRIDKMVDDNPTTHHDGESNYFVKLTIVKSIDFGQPDE